jgi:hypothetical protein
MRRFDCISETSAYSCTQQLEQPEHLYDLGGLLAIWLGFPQELKVAAELGAKDRIDI